jgi:aspartate racemase
VLANQGGSLKVRGPADALTSDLRRALADHKVALLALLSGRSASDEPVKVPRSGDQALSSAQQRLWFVTNLAPESSVAYNIPAAVRIGGDLRPDVLERALHEIFRRHETLRTSFVAVEGRPGQRVHDDVTLSLRRVELCSPNAEASRPGEPRRLDAALRDLLTEEVRRPFDLTQAPLVRGVLARIGDREHVLALVLHHLVSDGWSSGVLIEELAALYEAFAAGRPSPLPELPIQYGDYVAWQRQACDGPAMAEGLAFWKRALDGVPMLNLPTDHPRPPVQRYHGSSEPFVFPRALGDRLNEIARAEGATLFPVLLGAFATLLARYTGQADVAIGTSVANRGRKALEPLVGFFTNTLALRNDLAGNPPFTALLRQVRDNARAALDHQDVPFERIVEAVQPERVLSQNPLFQVCFSLLQAHRDTLRLGDLSITQIDVPSPAARFDLTLTMEDAREGLIGAFEYSTDLFDRGTIVRLIGHWRTLLEGIAADPACGVADLPLMSRAEREAIVVGLNQSASDYPRDATVHELFEAQAAATPERIAIRAAGRTLGYGELNARANQLARVLRARGVGPDVGVAIAALRSADMIVGLVAILKAGGYYVPFDPTDPAERLSFVFRQVHAAVMLAPKGLVPSLTAFGVEIVPLDGVDLDRESPRNLPNRTHPDNLVYTTYTSGSTGVPKGICIPHRGVVRLVKQTNYMDFEPSLVFLEIAPVSFDASTFEIWGALLSGAELVVMPPEIPSLRELGAAIERHGVTTLYLTSALFNLMVDERVEAFAGVKQLLVGGDIISVPHAKKLLAANAGVTLINGYGPTETTTFASCGIMRTPEEVGYTVTIGRPISNTTLYVLDDRLEPQPIGVPGDLFIAGDGNARGYLNLPGLTAETFVPDPFGAPGSRMYRTGDLSRYLADGTIEFLGRRDHQVKVRGFRIELGEIENVLTAVDGVSEAVVLVQEPRPNDKRLIAYVQPSPEPERPTLERAIVSRLREKLPDYMMPSVFVFVDAFPLTPHNKVDRKALAAIAAPDVDAHDGVAPRTDLEQVIASVWQDVLEAEWIGVDDNFFDLGGHSLLATQVMWRVFEIFQIEFPLRRLFESPTVAAFAAALEQEGGAERVRRIAELYLRVSRMSDEEVEGALRTNRSPSEDR